MTDRWPLHQNIMSYSIGKVEMKLNTTREEATKHLGVLNQYANGGTTGEYPFAARVIQDRIDLEDELARVRDALADARSELNKTELARDLITRGARIAKLQEAARAVVEWTEEKNINGQFPLQFFIDKLEQVLHP